MTACGHGSRSTRMPGLAVEAGNDVGARLRRGVRNTKSSAVLIGAVLGDRPDRQPIVGPSLLLGDLSVEIEAALVAQHPGNARPAPSASRQPAPIRAGRGGGPDRLPDRPCRRLRSSLRAAGAPARRRFPGRGRAPPQARRRASGAQDGALLLGRGDDDETVRGNVGRLKDLPKPRAEPMLWPSPRRSLPARRSPAMSPTWADPHPGLLVEASRGVAP
jgi:hypothetical protein